MEQSVAGLNRDTADANNAVQKLDAAAMQKEVEANREIKQETFNQAVKFTDEAYKKIFLEQAVMYVILTDENGKVIMDEDKGGIPKTRMLTPDEKFQLQPGSDNKVHIATNGIFNDEIAAGKYANQHNTGDGPQYLIHFPEANNTISELMIAGYQNYLEGTTLGLSNATKDVKDMMELYGQTGLHLDGHSRGSMTIGNAMEALLAQTDSNGELSNTTINFFGPAYNAIKADGILSLLQGREAVSDTATYNDMILKMQNHYADSVGVLIGHNSTTGGVVPADSSRIFEMFNVIFGKNTSHNCYELRPVDCAKYWTDSPSGFPNFGPVTPLRNK